MKLFYPGLLLLLVAAACGNEQPSGREGSPAATTVQDSVQGTPGAFYKRFSGSLGNRQIVLNLEQYQAEYEGCFYDHATNRPVRLINDRDTVQDEHYMLLEMDGQSTAGARWELTLHGQTLEGTRTAGDSTKTKVSLQEVYPEGSYRMAAYTYKGSGRLLEHRAQPQADAEYGMLWPSSGWDKEGSIFTSSRISVNMRFEGKNGVEEGLKARARRFYAGYRNELRPVVDSNWPEAKRADIAYHYTSSLYHHVLYNDGHWLVIEAQSSYYTGGAHGMYSSTFLNLDMTSHTDWDIRQVITDTAALKPYLNLAARDYFGIKNNEDLSSRLLLDEVPATANFYITPAGLTFVYNPYEIASYSDGQVPLFIRFDQLMPLLTPDFKAHMHFSAGGRTALRALPHPVSRIHHL